MLPTDFDIFSSATRIIPLCIQMPRERHPAGGLGLGDLVLVVGEDEIDAAAVDVEVGAQELLPAIAEHSMCQPGRPSPHGDGHEVSSSALCAFQSAKSSGSSLRLAVPASSPWSISSGSRLESLP